MAQILASRGGDWHPELHWFQQDRAPSSASQQQPRLQGPWPGPVLSASSKPGPAASVLQGGAGEWWPGKGRREGRNERGSRAELQDAASRGSGGVGLSRLTGRETEAQGASPSHVASQVLENLGLELWAAQTPVVRFYRSLHLRQGSTTAREVQGSLKSMCGTRRGGARL